MCVCVCVSVCVHECYSCMSVHVCMEYSAKLGLLHNLQFCKVRHEVLKGLNCMITATKHVYPTYTPVDMGVYFKEIPCRPKQ